MVPEILSKIQSDPIPLGYSVFLNGLGKYAIWVYEENIFEHCHLVHNFPTVPEILSKIQSDRFPLDYSVFSNGLNYAI